MITSMTFFHFLFLKYFEIIVKIVFAFLNRKSMKRVRLMRDAISKRRTRIDEIQVKGPSRELARLQTSKDHVDEQKKAWLDNLENIDSVSVCTFCGKRFERRAVLLSHLKVCQSKQKPNHSILLTKKAIDESSALPANISNNNTNETNNTWLANIDESSNSNSVDDIEAAVARHQMTNKRKRCKAVKTVINTERKDLDKEDDDMPESSTATEKSPTSIDGEIDLSDSCSNPDITTNVTKIKSEKCETPSSQQNTKKKPDTRCTYCHRTFSNTSNLRRHITMLHIRQQKYGCVLCIEFRSFRKSDVINHLQTEHELNSKKVNLTEYVCIREVNETKSIQLPSSNRRKDKHLEVLQDEVEVIIEPEQDADAEIEADAEEEQDREIISPTEELSELTTFAESNENSNADIDDAKEEDNEMTPESSNQETAEDIPQTKKKGRPKNSSRNAPKKIERSLSSGAVAISTSTRRPVRNRTIPVKKDFVYDLSTLLKKEAALYRDFQQTDETKSTPTTSQNQSRDTSPSSDQKPIRRRNTFQEPTVFSENSSLEQAEEILKTIKIEDDSQEEKPNVKCESILPIDEQKIKGCANIMATIAVNNNRAIFSKRLDSLKRVKELTGKSKRRSDSIRDWPILKRPMHEGFRTKSINTRTLLRNRKLARQKNANRHTIITTNLPKINGNNDKTDEKIIKISTRIADRLQMKKTENKFDEAMENGNKNELNADNHGNSDYIMTSPRRRVTLFERLAENKNKKLKESVNEKINYIKTNIDFGENSD